MKYIIYILIIKLIKQRMIRFFLLVIEICLFFLKNKFYFSKSLSFDLVLFHENQKMNF